MDFSLQKRTERLRGGSRYKKGKKNKQGKNEKTSAGRDKTATSWTGEIESQKHNRTRHCKQKKLEENPSTADEHSSKTWVL